MSISNAEKRLAIALENITKNAVRDDHDVALCVVNTKLINQASYLLQSLYPPEPSKEESDLGLLPKLVLTRSDLDGGWSLHPPGTTETQIAYGEVAPLLTGESLPSAVLGKKWARPNDQDYTSAYRSLLNVEIRRVADYI